MRPVSYFGFALLLWACGGASVATSSNDSGLSASVRVPGGMPARGTKITIARTPEESAAGLIPDLTRFVELADRDPLIFARAPAPRCASLGAWLDSLASDVSP